MPAHVVAGLRRAMELGLAAAGSTSPNPPVGAVLLDTAGYIVGEGATQPVGGAHAEVMAVRAAGSAARGSTAVVTLEPCNHTGRTGPCSTMLIEAGVAEVYFLHSDPNPVAAGGSATLRAAGVEVHHIEIPTDDFRRSLPADALVPWLTATKLNRPHITLKFGQTLDGFSAAVDGSSKWITGPVARQFAHADRARRDAIVVGTGTALSDNPSLTARDPHGELYPHQPRRVVIGKRPIANAPVASNLNALGFEQFDSIDCALQALYEQGVRSILVEGGPGLASAFLAAELVDAIHAYIAPALLGHGRSILAHPLADTIANAHRFERTGLVELGDDVLITYARPRAS
ncbi:MAG: bifunctional diaminohydroxyphosphoribosylaminopyrimidine deaminase/5-amino-6-(5-phosphoribosylamino)uracil reductase RibD [Corynebacterium sp.]|nr:bifunctional diaminohydroxyphosphoribosylaminopyrimidine deaminase/5-amino-6-(5-phosphoribosylamino)uracil reductase RibD [Corynebacterium sp.]